MSNNQTYKPFTGNLLDHRNHSGEDMREVDFLAYKKDKNLSEFNFSKANLSGVNLNTFNLDKANLSAAILQEIKLSSASLVNAILSGADLKGANLSGADLSGADLSHANLEGADLSSANLSGADLSSTSLVGANMNNATLIKADLSSAHPADLSNAYLIKANLTESILSGANLTGAKLIEATLKYANLSRAVLRKADLSNADLTKANLSEVDLTAAILQETQLEEAILNKIIMNEETQIEGIKLSRDALGEINLEDAKAFTEIIIDKKAMNSKEAINASKAAKTFLSNIQWVFDALSVRVNQYYDNVLEQSKNSFKIALIFAVVGTSLFLVTFSLFIIFSLLSERIEYSSVIAAIGAIGGTLIEVISGIAFVLYARTSNQLKSFHISLNRTQQFLLANSICENLDGREKQLARANLIDKLVETPIYAVQEGQKVIPDENSKIFNNAKFGKPADNKNRAL